MCHDNVLIIFPHLHMHGNISKNQTIRKSWAKTVAFLRIIKEEKKPTQTHNINPHASLDRMAT